MHRHKFIRGFGVIAVAVALGAGALAAPAGAGDNSASGASSKAKRQSIAVIAAKNPEFSTLSTAVKAAGLKKTLSGKGPFTVFAPTDDAFAGVPSGTLEALLADKEALAGVLTYHVLKGKVPSSSLQPTQTVMSVNSEPFTITVADGKATITDAQGNSINIVQTDVKAKNGVIHVIDGVMLPSS